MLSATSILLAFWLAVVLLCDIDGFERSAETQGPRRRRRRRYSGSRETLG